MSILWVGILTMAVGQGTGFQQAANEAGQFPQASPAAVESQESSYASPGANQAASLPATSAQPVTQPAEPSLSGLPLLEAVRGSLRKWARPTDAQAGEAARELLMRYNQLEADKAMPRHRRTEYLGVYRSRLRRLSDQMEKKLVKEGRMQPATIRAPGGSNAAMGQMFGGGGVNMQQGGGAFNFGGGANAGGRRIPGDYGPDLVELIQKTICPRTWDVNGGPGVIRYWPAQHSIIVTAPQAAHDEINGVLRQLEKMNR